MSDRVHIYWSSFFRGKTHKAENPAAAGERFVAVVVFLLVFIAAARTPLDSDMWWHLRAGEEMLQSGQPLLKDLFSFTVNGQGWINHSWLSEVGMAALVRSSGMAGLCTVMALLATISMVFVYDQMEVPGILRGFILFLGVLVAAPVWSPRPQLVSLVLMSLTAWILFRFKWRKKNALWILPIVFLVWSNLHGGYPLGLMVIGAMIAGETIDHILGFTGDGGLSWRQIGSLGLWALACVFVVMINPNGINMWKIPFQTVGVTVLQQFITEWASPDFHDVSQLPFLILLMGVIISTAISQRRLNGTELIGVVLFGSMALVARRNFGPFAIVATPILAKQIWAAYLSWNERTGILTRWVGRVSEISSDTTFPEWVSRTINLCGAGFLMFCAFWKVYGVSHPALISSQLAQSEPVAAVEWMRANDIRGNILNEYTWGGYLDWAAPESRVFVDGRTDLFGDRVIRDWITLVKAGDGWETTLEKYPVDLVLLEPGRPVVALLKADGWRVVYTDQVSILLQK